jgi:signal transduction histidine kinase
VHHSAASVLRIAVTSSAEGVGIRICDDGKGLAGPIIPGRGSGLRGMRERVAEFKGRLTPLTPQDGGFGWDIWLPAPVEAA